MGEYAFCKALWRHCTCDTLCSDTSILLLVTNDSKATVSVLYWYGNYPTLTEHVSDFLGPGPALAPGQLLFIPTRISFPFLCGEVAERSKALRQGRNLFGGVGSNPTLVTFAVGDRMAEWSKAPDPSSGLFGGAGSNPAPVTRLALERQHGKTSNALLPGFEPGLPDSRSGVLTTTLRELALDSWERPHGVAVALRIPNPTTAVRFRLRSLFRQWFASCTKKKNKGHQPQHVPHGAVGSASGC